MWLRWYRMTGNLQQIKMHDTSSLEVDVLNSRSDSTPVSHLKTVIRVYSEYRLWTWLLKIRNCLPINPGGGCGMVWGMISWCTWFHLNASLPLFECHTCLSYVADSALMEQFTYLYIGACIRAGIAPCHKAQAVSNRLHESPVYVSGLLFTMSESTKVPLGWDL